MRQMTGTGSAGTSGGFSYRVVAKCADINGEWLATFDLPKIKIPKPEEMPILPSGHPEPPRKQ